MPGLSAPWGEFTGGVGESVAGGQVGIYLECALFLIDDVRRFLYTLFLALDACFRLKRRLVSSELRDPDLGSGWAYMVTTAPYREYLRTVTDQKEVSFSCGIRALPA